MILCALLGLAVQLLFHVDIALAAGVVLGLVVAQFVPLATSCSQKPPEKAG